MYVRTFAYSSGTDKPIGTKLGILILWDQEEILERSKLRKSVQSSSPSEGGSCSSETKHNRRTAPRPKLFASTRKLQEQRPQLRKPVLCSNHGEDGFCSSETKHDIRRVPRPELFVSAGRLLEVRSQSLKLSWVRVSVKMLGLWIIIIIIIIVIVYVILNDTYRMIRPMVSFREIKIDKKYKYLSNFFTVTLRALC
jgi:hypothetical protein